MIYKMHKHYLSIYVYLLMFAQIKTLYMKQECDYYYYLDAETVNANSKNANPAAGTTTESQSFRGESDNIGRVGLSSTTGLQSSKPRCARSSQMQGLTKSICLTLMKSFFLTNLTFDFEKTHQE